VCIMFRGVQKLLDATGQRMVDVGTNDGHTPLHVAAVNGLRQIAQLLLETVSYKSEMVGSSLMNSVLDTDAEIILWNFGFHESFIKRRPECEEQLAKFVY